MGKMIRSYSIFVLFLLMSMSVFADIHIKSIDATNHPTIVITFNGNTKGSKINFLKEEATDSFSEHSYEEFKNQEITGTSITYVSKLKDGEKYLYGKTTLVSINVTSGKKTYTITKKETSYEVPMESKDIEIKTYEEIYQVDKSKIKKDGYIFTKGGAGSYVEKPVIYVTIPVSEEIKKLKIQKLVNGKFKNKDKNKNKAITSIVSSDDENNVVRVEFDFEEGTNTVKIIPINKDNVKGEPKILDFVVDTKIKNSYLEKEGIIGELQAKEIKIKLSKFEELSGINKYSYTLSNGFQREAEKGAVDGGKYLTPTEDGALADIKIPLGDFSEGSRLTLSFSVYDRLGHKKTYEKTYFMPKQSDGITAKVSGDVKQRRSKIKIITEGNKDKFGIGSSIDGSSEEDETSISGS